MYIENPQIVDYICGGVVIGSESTKPTYLNVFTNAQNQVAHQTALSNNN